MSTLASKLSYANVTATLALFVALGGSAYAVSQIDGGDIRDRSIPGSKLKKHAVTSKELKTKGLIVPRAMTADQVTKLNVTSSAKRQNKDSTGLAKQAAGAGDGSLLKLSAGQTVNIFNRGPFTVSATCIDLGGGSVQAKTLVTSSEGGWLADGIAPHAAGESVELGSTPPGEMGKQPLLGREAGSHLLVTAGGTAVAVSQALGVHVADADCVVYASAIG